MKEEYLLKVYDLKKPISNFSKISRDICNICFLSPHPNIRNYTNIYKTKENKIIVQSELIR